MKDKFRRSVLFPFLFALFPILTLWASNVRSVIPWMTLRTILLTLAVFAILFFIFRYLFKNALKAGILVCVLILIFFSYGHLYNLVADRTIFGFLQLRHRHLIFASIVIIGLTTWLLIRQHNVNEKLMAPLNLIAAVILIYPISMIISHQIETVLSNDRIAKQANNSNAASASIPRLDVTKSGYRPDIYYIVLDSYTNQDVLKNCFSYDNSAFLDELRNLGFYIADESRTNFTITDLSLAASLNMNYPQQMGNSPAEASNTADLYNWLQNNMVQTALKNAGYKTVAFETGYSPTELTHADYYYTPYEGINKYLDGLNSFESMAMRTSAGIILYDLKDHLPLPIKMMLDSEYILHRNRILNILDKLETVPEKGEPTFTFAHILAPHNPFVFGPNGEDVSRHTPFTLNDDQDITSANKYMIGYDNQVQYLNKRIIDIVKTILEKSKNPPIIILQGDHGPSKWAASKVERTYILNAYFIPQGYADLYKDISPVNSFRVIFNEVFGTSMPKLNDETFYTTHSTIDELTLMRKRPVKCTPGILK